MRICRVAISYPTTDSPGAGLVAYYLCKHIMMPTIYLTIRRDGDMSPSPSPNIVIEAMDIPIEKSSLALNHSLHKPNLNRVQRFLVYIKIALSGRSIKFLAHSIPIIIRFRPDIICCHSNLTLYIGLFFNLFYRKKFVFHIHAMSDAIAICNLPILRWMVNRASRIYCISESVRDKLKYVIPFYKLKLTSTGVDPNVFYRINSPKKKQIIQVGQLMWYKGHRYLLEAMPAILSKHPDYQLIIVGKGQLKSEISEFIKDNGLSESIKMVSNLTHGELRVLYNESMLLVMPSLFEGLPKVLLEAFSCGLPAVITKSCNAKNISAGRAIIVEKESSSALAEAVCCILDDHLMWKTFSKNCVDIIHTHDWKIISKNIFEDYRKVLYSNNYT